MRVLESRPAALGALSCVFPWLVLGSLVFAWSVPVSAQAYGYSSDDPVPASYARFLAPEQRLSIERGAADLEGATQQSILAAVLYVSSAATLVVAIATTIVLFAELLPPRPFGFGYGWGPAEAAALGTIVGSFAAHAITTPLAIVIGRNAERRRERARQQMFLVQSTLTPFGVSVSASF